MSEDVKNLTVDELDSVTGGTLSGKNKEWLYYLLRTLKYCLVTKKIAMNLAPEYYEGLPDKNGVTIDDVYAAIDEVWG